MTPCTAVRDTRVQQREEDTPCTAGGTPVGNSRRDPPWVTAGMCSGDESIEQEQGCVVGTRSIDQEVLPTRRI